MDMTREYWNGEAGTVWLSHTPVLDVMLASFGERAIEALAPRPGERVLDIGCGGGATSRRIAELVGPAGRVVGADISRQLVEAAEAAGGGPTYVCGDAGADPLPGPFDAAFSRFGVMFFADPPAAFAHIRGAMRPGGRLAFVCWRSLLENAWATETFATAIPFLRELPPPPPPHAPGPFAFADGDRVRDILAGAGWSDVAVRPLDTGYLLGTTVDQALAVMLRIGPLGRVIREQELDPAPIRAALMGLLARYTTDGGVVMPAACHVVTATA